MNEDWPAKDMPNELSLNEAVIYVMKVTGKTRRQAKAMLIEGFRKGRLKLQAHAPDGAIAEIPRELFDGPIQDDEGDWYGLN